MEEAVQSGDDSGLQAGQILACTGLCASYDAHRRVVRSDHLDPGAQHLSGSQVGSDGVQQAGAGYWLVGWQVWQQDQSDHAGRLHAGESGMFVRENGHAGQPHAGRLFGQHPVILHVDRALGLMPGLEGASAGLFHRFGRHPARGRQRVADLDDSLA